MAALAMGVGGCGSDDDGGGGQADDGGHTGRAAEINETLAGIQEDYRELDGSSFCDRLTAAGQRQVEQFGKAFGYGSDCAKIIDVVSKRTRASGVKQRPTKLISVKFRGDRAIATVSNGGRPPEPMILVNDQGDWKVPDPGFRATIGGRTAKRLSSDPAKRFQQVKRARDIVKSRQQDGDQ